MVGIYIPWNSQRLLCGHGRLVFLGILVRGANMHTAKENERNDISLSGLNESKWLVNLASSGQWSSKRNQAIAIA